MAISKIILNGVTQIDLTSDTVAANNLIAPNTAHGADGNPITGTATGGVSGTYMFPLVLNNDDIYVPTITNFTEVKNAQDVQYLTLYGYNVAGAVFAYASYYENYEGYSECVVYGYITTFSDYDTGGDIRNYGYASVYVTYGYYNGALKTDYAVYKDGYNTSGATATADKILGGYSAYGPNGIIDGTASGGGSSKAIYTYKGFASRTANSYGSTSASVTVTKAGTYTISYVAIRGSSSGTMGTNLHIGSATGTNNTTWNNGTYGQYVSLTGQTIAANTTVTIYATSGSNSRTIYVGNLIIEEQ